MNSTNSPGSGLDISQWGPQAWKFMHAVTFAYPENPTPEQKQAAIAFFSSLSKLLPCEKCRDHFSIGLEVQPVEKFCDSRANLSRWLVDFHNAVNSRLGKAFVEYEQMCKVYLGTTASTAATRSCARDMQSQNTSTSSSAKPGNSYYPTLAQMEAHVQMPSHIYKQKRAGEFAMDGQALVADDFQLLPSGQHAVCPLGARGNTNEDAKNAFNLLEETKEKHYMEKGMKKGAGITIGVVAGVALLFIIYMKYFRKQKKNSSLEEPLLGENYQRLE